MKFKKILILFSTFLLVSCSNKLLDGEILRSDAINSFKDLPTAENFKYEKYSFEGEMNFFGDTQKYKLNDYNRPIIKNDKIRVSEYFGIPLYLNDGKTVETNFSIVDKKLAAPDSIAVIKYVVPTDGGIEFTIFNANKRLVLPIPDLDLEISAKWNIKITYDVEGKLVEEYAATINKDSAPITESIYLESHYSYNE